MEVPADLVLAVAAVERDQQCGAGHDTCWPCARPPRCRRSPARSLRALQRSIPACAASRPSITLGSAPSQREPPSASRCRTPDRRRRAPRPHDRPLGLEHDVRHSPPLPRQAGTEAKARTGNVPNSATIGGAAVKRAPVEAAHRDRCRCSTIGMPASSSTRMRRPLAVGHVVDVGRVDPDQGGALPRPATRRLHVSGTTGRRRTPACRTATRRRCAATPPCLVRRAPAASRRRSRVPPDPATRTTTVARSASCSRGSRTGRRRPRSGGAVQSR